MLERMATINSKSWHYRLVTRIDKIMHEETVIKGPFQYWLGIVPLYLFFTAFVGGMGLAVIGALGLMIYDMVTAVWASPVHTLWGATWFIGTAVAGAVALLFICVSLAELGERIHKKLPSIRIK